MGTITVNLKDNIEQEFREVAVETFGKGKGHLGRAFAEALQNWVREHKQEKIAKEALDMMDRGFACGKLMYRQRSELHER